MYLFTTLEAYEIQSHRHRRRYEVVQVRVLITVTLTRWHEMRYVKNH